MDDSKRLNESKLSLENGDIYLFQWLSSLEKSFSKFTPEELKSSQAELEATFVKVIVAPSPYPPPGRPLRNLVARCLITLYSLGETRSLFETLQTFLATVGDFKIIDRDINKIAAIFCVGELMSKFGSQVMSFMVEIVTVMLKIFKTSSFVLLRYHALVALRNSLSTARRATTDALAKEILKQMKYGLGDKSLAIQRAAAEVLMTMYSSGHDIRTAADVESVVVLCTKSLEVADQITRHSLSRLVGQVLVSTRVEVQPPASDPKKGSRDEDDETGPSANAEVVKTILNPGEMLLLLSTQLNKQIPSRKLRIGLFDFYAALISALGPAFVEHHYALVVNHFMVEIVSNQRNRSTHYEELLVQRLVGIILRDLIGVRMLSEQAQIAAIQELSSSYLKRWPAMMPGQIEPNSSVLVIALKEVSGLVQQLGNAPLPVQDALVEPLVTLLSHPSHATRVNVAQTLRCFCESTPLQLPKTLLNVIDMLQRDIDSLTVPVAPSDRSSRALGHAYGLAALVAIIPERPLYVSYDISAKVLDTAIQLLKRAGDHDIDIAAVEVEVAWIAIASLVTLGPNFVRPHLPQLLVLWRNALPKPTSKDSVSVTGRTASEWAFLIHVRESALGAILCFLRHNSPVLVTLDVARRLASLLSNALLFANAFTAQNVEELDDQYQRTVTKGLSLRFREALLRRRVYQCFTALGFSGITESTQASLLQSTVHLFASHDGYNGSSIQAAIVSSTGSFMSVWQSVDGYAYGVTNIEISRAASDEPSVPSKQDRLNRDTVEISIDDLHRKPIVGSCEYDPLTLCQPGNTMTDPPPAITAVVDAAIELFAELLPLQDLGSTIRVVSQLIESVRSAKLEKNAGRKAAVFINAVVALTLALRRVTSRQAREVFADLQLTSVLSVFLKDALIEGDSVLRIAGSEAIGRLASLGGTVFLTNQIKQLVDHVLSNRDPHGRAGCAMAFGAIHSYVGGLAAGPLLKTSVNILMSLSNDPHPVVHFWSLDALGQVITAASLAYAPFVSSTLGMLFKLYLLDSHEQEGGTLINANIKGDLPAYQVVCHVIDAVITVLGPDMQELNATRNLVLDLVHQFSLEDDDGIRVEAIKCIQHSLMFAPDYVPMSQLVDQLSGHLSSSRRPLKFAAINALYQLVQRDAFAMSRVGGDKLVEQLFAMLDDDPSIDGVRNVISSWLGQTAIHNPSAWIDLCQRIMSRTTASQQATDAATKGSLRDDEGESLNFGVDSGDSREGQTHSTSRWRTQLFALQCLHHICVIVLRSGRREHIDIPFARSRGFHTSALLVSRVADLIKMAFTASAAYVTEIRLEGLVVLRDVIKIFAKAPDPDYEDSLLLEQYQAPVTAALTPAFSSESTPNILASAIETCAIFVGCGVIKDVGRMGRILKLLTSALEQSKDAGTLTLGDAGPLSPNASVMLRVATSSAWAELQVASSEQTYLQAIVKPYRSILSSLWLGSLRDYASIRAEAEAAQDTSSTALEASYSSLGREVLLPYYVDAWPVILQAVALVMVANDPCVLAGMDGPEGNTKNTLDGRVREEPTGLFFVIYGLIYDALASSSVDPSSNLSSLRIPEIALSALKSLVRPEYSGKALLQSSIFEEFIGLCYRLAITETPAAQIQLLGTLTSLATSQSRNSATLHIDRRQVDIPQAHCLRVCAFVLRRALPGPGDVITYARTSLTDRLSLIRAAFEAFADIGITLGPDRQEEIRSAGISLYSELLKDESSEIDCVGSTLQSLKLYLERPADSHASEEKYAQVIHGILSVCLINVDNMRGRQGSIASKIVKNNLLAAVLILTSVSSSVKFGKAVVERSCFLISQQLLDHGETSLTAAHCAKTLVVASTSGNATLRHCMRILLSSLIEYMTSMAGLEDQQVTDAHLSATAEVWKAFSAYFGSVAPDLQVRFLGILLPSIIFLLNPSQTPHYALHSQSVSQLLLYASSSPVAFKEATAKLPSMGREVLEESLRLALGAKQSMGEAEVRRPQISLRAF